MDIGSIADWNLTEDGGLMLVDELRHCVLRQDAYGNVKARGRRGNRAGEFHYPRSILVKGDSAYVVDSWNHRVQVFDAVSWKFLFEFGGFGSGPGQFFCPSWIVAIDERLIIADTNNARLSFHSRDGSFLFASYFADGRFPRKLQVSGGMIEVQYDSGERARLEYL